MMDASIIVMDGSMNYILLVVSGMLITNGIPHFVQGLSGEPFQSPFATPSGIGESSPLVNVYWGFVNLVGGAVLLTRFMPTAYLEWACVGVGSLLIGTFCSMHFGKVRANKQVTS
jgi:hypothetical protein